MRQISYKWIIPIFLFLGFIALSWGEDTEKESNTKPFATVFTFWVYDLEKDASPISGFDLSRAYFGVKHNFQDKADLKLTLDVGRTNAITSVDTNFSTKKNVTLEAFLKTAQLTYHLVPQFEITGGLHGLKQFGVQEKLWGNRYIYKSFMDEHKYGSSADLGLTATLKPSKVIKVHATLINGEGYKKLQADNNFKSALGAEINPIQPLIIYVYGDVMPTAAETQTTIATFLGYTIKELIRVGAEFNMQLANGGVKDMDLMGVSGYAAFTINKMFEIFGRYDMATCKMNMANSIEGQLILVGVQAQPFKGLKTSLNFQDWIPKASGTDPQPKIYLNNEFKF